MVTRRTGIGVGVALVALALVLWRCAGTPGTATTTPPASAPERGATTDRFGARAAALDPKAPPRGSIAGTVRDETAQPIATAVVCADLWSKALPPELVRDPICVKTDARGGYQLTALHPATYTIAAGAPRFLAASFHPGGDPRVEEFELGPAEARTGVDLVLRAGGVELTGVVSDISGGPVARAQVRATAGRWGQGIASPPVETDDAGAFAVWVRPGSVSVEVSADGYAPASENGQAPGTLDVLLTPEASLAGIVVDAISGSPIGGARVSASASEWSNANDEAAITDDAGAFRIARLVPGRYVVNARTEQGYGRGAGSTLVGLGQHVTGVTVKLHAAARIVGTIRVPGSPPGPCTKGSASFHDEVRDREASASVRPDGSIIAEAVLPGTYVPRIHCEGFQSRDTYPPIEVADREVTGLVWEVDAGALIRGRVTTRAGAAVVGAQVSGRTTGGAARERGDWAGDDTLADGSFELRGLRPGTYKLDVSSDEGTSPLEATQVEVAAGAVVEQSLIIDDGGTIEGTVVDAAGKPVAGVSVGANALASGGGWAAPSKTNAAGAYTIKPLRPGAYLVTARRGWMDRLRKPGSTDDARQGEPATVRAGKVTTVRLTVEQQDGVIRGNVIDHAGAPVTDAYVSAVRESDAAGSASTAAHQTRGWGWGDDRPSLTGTDGSFEIGALSEGRYTLRAYRKGGGEAIAEHVELGARATLQIKGTGSIAGVVTVAGGGVVEQLKLEVTDKRTGFSRGEDFFRTGGRFTITDLPAGTFKITANAAGGSKLIDLSLAGGETRTDVTIELDALVTLIGRVIDLASRAPVAGFRMSASPAAGGFGSMSWSVDDRSNISGDDGRFTILRVPTGKLSLMGLPKSYGDSAYPFLRATRTVTGTGTVDVGDLTVMRKRLQRGEVAGELGVRFKERPPEIEPEAWKMEVSYIDPAGPAAGTGLVVGDVVASIDGVDVTGEHQVQSWPLMRAPVGTKLALGLARGTTIVVTLAAP